MGIHLDLTSVATNGLGETERKGLGELLDRHLMLGKLNRKEKQLSSSIQEKRQKTQKHYTTRVGDVTLAYSLMCITPKDASPVIWVPIMRDEAYRLGAGTYGNVFKTPFVVLHYPDATNELNKVRLVSTELALKKFKKNINHVSPRDMTARTQFERDILASNYHLAWHKEHHSMSGGNSRNYLLSPFLGEQTLTSFLKTMTLTLEECDSLCFALALAYQNFRIRTQEKFKGQDFAHADLKPDNILIQPLENGQFTVAITDFGLTRGEQESSSLVGTTKYLPFDLLSSDRYVYNEKVDIASLGCVFAEIYDYSEDDPFKQLNKEAARTRIMTHPNPYNLPALDEVDDPETQARLTFIYGLMSRSASDRPDIKGVIEFYTRLLALDTLMYTPDPRDKAYALCDKFLNREFDGDDTKDGIKHQWADAATKTRQNRKDTYAALLGEVFQKQQSITHQSPESLSTTVFDQTRKGIRDAFRSNDMVSELEGHRKDIRPRYKVPSSASLSSSDSLSSSPESYIKAYDKLSFLEQVVHAGPTRSLRLAAKITAELKEREPFNVITDKKVPELPQALRFKPYHCVAKLS